MNNLEEGMNDSEDIYLEDVEVNETPGNQMGGSVQVGGFIDFTQDPFTKYFLTESKELIDTVVHGYSIKTDKKGKIVQVTPKTADKDIKEDYTIYLSPLSFYFREGANPNDDVVVFDSYANYIASIRTTGPKPKTYFGSQKNAKIVPNIFDKIIYDLLSFTQKEKIAGNWDNVKAFISMISRLYVLFINIFFKPENALPIRENNSPFLRDSYDLFNGLEILTALGFFGDGMVSSANDGQFTLDLPAAVAAPATPREKAVVELNNPQKYPPPQGGVIAQKNPQFELPAGVNYILSTIFKAILSNGGTALNPVAPADYVDKHMNFTYYLLEYAYQNISTQLYTIFKVYVQKDQNEVKTYNEFRTTKDFLNSMPPIIEQAFKTQAVVTARATATDPINVVDKFMKDIFELLKSGTTQAQVVVGGADADPVKQAKFTAIINELNTNKIPILGSSDVTLNEAGFSKTAFRTIQSKNPFYTPPAPPAPPGPAAQGQTTFDDLKTLITTKEYYTQIKDLTTLLDKQKKAKPSADRAFTDAQTAINGVAIPGVANPPFVDKLAAATPQQRNDYNRKKAEKDKIDRDIMHLSVEIFNIIKSLTNDRLDEEPFKEKYLFFTPIINYPVTVGETEITAINTARDAVLAKNLLDNGPQNPVINAAAIPNLDAANNRIKEYIQGNVANIDPQSPLGLRNTLVEKYEAYKKVFMPTSQYRNSAMVTAIESAITAIKNAAPLNIANIANIDQAGYTTATAAAAPDTPLNTLPANVQALYPANPPGQLTALQVLISTKIAQARDEMIALKTLLTPAFAQNAPNVPNGLDATAAAIAEGQQHEPPKPTATAIKDDFIEALLKVAGGYKRNTRRNRHRKNATTRRNNEMSY